MMRQLSWSLQWELVKFSAIKFIPRDAHTQIYESLRVSVKVGAISPRFVLFFLANIFPIHQKVIIFHLSLLILVAFWTKQSLDFTCPSEKRGENAFMTK